MTDSTEETRLWGLRPSSSFKDSGIHWLGEIPAHWHLTRLKNTVVRLESGGTPESDNFRYWTDEKHGIPWVAISDMTRSFRLRETAKRITEAGRVSKRLRKLPVGTLLYSMYASLGKVALLETEAVVNQAILGVVPRESETHRDYLRWWFEFMKAHVQMLSSSNTQDNLSADRVRNMPVVLPPGIREQQSIAAFLDRETAKIDALLAKKEQLIELLQEKRTALITRAVTGGLDPNVPMKDSGVEWLGAIPTHWETLALSRVAISRCDGPFGSGLKAEHYSESGVRVVRLQNIGWAEFMNSDAAYLDEAYARRLGDHSVKCEDILIAGLGDEGHPVGRACVAPITIEPAMVKADCFRFRLDRRRVLPRYAAFQLSATASGVAGYHATGATRTRVNLANCARRMIVLPPLNEQEAIATFLDHETTRIDTLLDKVRQAIDRLNQYRAALISAAVTGKIDVQNEAA